MAALDWPDCLTIPPILSDEEFDWGLAITN